jgi:protein-S-isoprenylcysteine O-methyltransferase Ste14
MTLAAWRALLPALWVIPLIAGAVLLRVPHILGPQLEQRFHPHTFGWSVAGVVLVAVGIGFSIAARVWLGSNWSSIVTLKQDHELIRSGPYAWVRHPIYSGLLCALFDTAIVIGSWRALIGLALLVAAILRKLTIEERFMTEQFGEVYVRYRAEVPALIPFVV